MVFIKFKESGIEEFPVDGIIRANVYFLIYTATFVYKDKVYLQDNLLGSNQPMKMYCVSVDSSGRKTCKDSRRSTNGMLLTGVDSANIYFQHLSTDEKSIEVTIVKIIDMF